MDDLDLPVLVGNKSNSKILSMDDYFEFVKFHLEHTFDRAAYKTWKELLTVDVTFSL